MDKAPNPIRPRTTRVNLMGTSPGMLVGANLAFAARGASSRYAERNACCFPNRTVPHARPLQRGGGFSSAHHSGAASLITHRARRHRPDVPLSRVDLASSTLITCCASWTCSQRIGLPCVTPTQSSSTTKAALTTRRYVHGGVHRARQGPEPRPAMLASAMTRRPSVAGSRAPEENPGDAPTLRSFMARNGRRLEGAVRVPQRSRRLHQLHRGHTPGNASAAQPEPHVGYVEDSPSRTRDKCR